MYAYIFCMLAYTGTWYVWLHTEVHGLAYVHRIPTDALYSHTNWCAYQQMRVHMRALTPTQIHFRALSPSLWHTHKHTHTHKDACTHKQTALHDDMHLQLSTHLRCIKIHLQLCTHFHTLVHTDTPTRKHTRAHTLTQVLMPRPIPIHIPIHVHIRGIPHRSIEFERGPILGSRLLESSVQMNALNVSSIRNSNRFERFQYVFVCVCTRVE